MNMLALMILFEGRGLLYREYYLGENCHHRRTGIFLPGGGGKPFAQKNFAGCPNFYERVGKRGGSYYNNIGRTGI